jgi:hypothetical protein
VLVAAGRVARRRAPIERAARVVGRRCSVDTRAQARRAEARAMIPSWRVTLAIA